MKIKKFIASVLAVVLTASNLICLGASASVYKEKEENTLEPCSIYYSDVMDSLEQEDPSLKTANNITTEVDGVTYTLSISYIAEKDGDIEFVSDCKATITKVEDNRLTAIVVPESVSDLNYPDGYKGPIFNDNIPVVALGDGAFSKTSYVSDVTIPDTVEKIGKKCFYGSHLYSFHTTRDSLTVDDGAFGNTFMKSIPEDLKNINLDMGENVFADNKFLDVVDTGIWTDLPVGLFYNCANISEVTINSYVETIGEISVTETLYDSGEIEYITFNGSNTGAFQKCPNLKILNIEDASKIKRLGDNTFSGCTSLLEASFDNFTIEHYEIEHHYTPESGENYTVDVPVGIGPNTFANCTHLEKASIGNYDTVPQKAFIGCTALTDVNINNVQYICGNAFNGCTKLESVTIPESCLSIGIGAFSKCTSLKNIDIPEAVYYVGSGAFEGDSSLVEVTGCENAWSCGIIKANTFKDCSSLTGVANFDDVITIWKNAFSNTSLRDLDLTNVKYIHTSAFNSCKFLSTVKALNVEYIGPNAFKDCTNLSTVELDLIDEISDSAFANCSNLKDIVMPNVKVIGNSTFSGCSKINPVLPDCILEVGNSAFANCVNFNPDLSGKTWHLIGSNAFYNTGLETVQIDYDSDPKATLVIGDKAFANCSKLTQAKIECKTTSDVGDSVFSNCTALEYAYYSDRIVGTSMFENCKNLKQIEIPYVVSIGNKAFYNCNSLETFDAPASLEDINANAFENCESLTGINFNNISNVTYNGKAIFRNCKSLISIDLNTNIISPEMFYGCESLTEVNTTSPIIEIDDSAFAFCKALQSLDLSSARVLKVSCFENSGLVNVVLADDTPDIPNNAFKNCTSLQSITIPSSISSIGVNAFSNCTALTEILIPSSVSTISKNAFSDCKALSKVTFENGNKIQTIADNTFRNCIALTEIVIPSSIKTIGSSAFEGDISLTQVKFEDITIDNLAEVSAGAFYGCTSLNYLYLPYSRTNLNNLSVGILAGSASNPTINENMVVYGIINSPVQEYCDELGIKFVAIEVVDEVIKGDINRDQRVTTMDILALKKYILGIDDNSSVIYADMNEDGLANIIDLCILKSKFLS